ncbi:MAG: ATP-binding protein [Pirellulaceae bacterium]|nr:ATP-binding protein [Pirellulaceae bacterium]
MTMTEPTILKFPQASPVPPAATAPGELDLQAILFAWNQATDRLQKTHEALQSEIHRLTDELEVKNRELARQNRLADLGQMAAHVAHEVRNSLVPMKLYLSLLRRRISGDLGSLDVLDKVTAGFTALEATVSDLLHFSSDRQPKRERFDARQLIDEVGQLLAPQLDAQAIVCELDCPAELPLRADRDMLRRALLNLVLNALDAMPTGGRLVITVWPGPEGVEIEVADSGPGIDPATLTHLAEPFFTTKASGTGLGLAIVDRIVTAHEGRLLVANCPEGGAAFTLCIPSRAVALEKAA